MGNNNAHDTHAGPANVVETNERYVVTVGRLITGRPGESLADQAVAVDGRRIAWVGDVAALPAEYADWARADYSGYTLLPGLVETHAHFGARPGSAPNVSDPARHVQGWNALHSLHWAQQLASLGVTSAQSLGSKYFTDVALREAINAGLAEGPRIVAAGSMITTTGGHDWKDSGEVDSLDDIRHAVRDHHKAGVDTIKAAATGGFFTPGTAQWKAQFTVEELRTLVDEAHRLGHPVAVHAHGTQGIRRAVEAGVDYIAHGTFISDDGTTRFDPELADQIAEKGIYVDVAAPPSYPPVEGETIAPRALDLYRHGVKIVTGHDIGAVIPPNAYLYGLHQLEASGIPRAEILVAATSRAAAAIGLAGVAGVIAPEYDADLLIVDGNPLDDLNALERRQLIITRGQVFHPVPVEEYHGRKRDGKGHTNNVLEERFARVSRAALQNW
ncbi:amidohydrolase family protein [Bifidobacterium biavatii]|uniref:Amidohydrolase family protein n=1 Tax=Bifidobacterium biavatii DSM 23969 TaxID=1437608 RepID=A0A086ZVY3_9BIFI|nr:amidohydrolase family protein [Bifidobacterium biavatii]KFI50683.1 amidohydrolase family protein [Bifidobacterium biavatii DSM 23969]